MYNGTSCLYIYIYIYMKRFVRLNGLNWKQKMMQSCVHWTVLYKAKDLIKHTFKLKGFPSYRKV